MERRGKTVRFPRHKTNAGRTSSKQRKQTRKQVRTRKRHGNRGMTARCTVRDTKNDNAVPGSRTNRPPNEKICRSPKVEIARQEQTTAKRERGKKKPPVSSEAPRPFCRGAQLFPRSRAAEPAKPGNNRRGAGEIIPPALPFPSFLPLPSPAHKKRITPGAGPGVTLPGTLVWRQAKPGDRIEGARGKSFPPLCLFRLSCLFLSRRIKKNHSRRGAGRDSSGHARLAAGEAWRQNRGGAGEIISPACLFHLSCLYSASPRSLSCSLT